MHVQINPPVIPGIGRSDCLLIEFNLMAVTSESMAAVDWHSGLFSKIHCQPIKRIAFSLGEC